jgi:hypothetical protein
LITKSDISIF